MCVSVLGSVCTIAVIWKTGPRSDDSVAISPLYFFLSTRTVNYFTNELSIKIAIIYSDPNIFLTVEHVCVLWAYSARSL